jgi:anti-sigma factor (TIGR02949 family)
MPHQHDCQKYLPGLSDYIDGDLNPELCAELERHMADCERCRIVVDTTRKTIELYQTSDSQQKAPSDVRERLYKRLELEDLLIQKGGKSQHE